MIRDTVTTSMSQETRHLFSDRPLTVPDLQNKWKGLSMNLRDCKLHYHNPPPEKLLINPN